ncbi:MAG TPA: flagellar motor switch protein FliM, partial [bacterium]|nr:flagellar motor switch protein FliM [bacterium]
LFTLLHVEAYVGASVVEEMRFAAFHAALKRPRPIYFFTMSPLQGTGLLVLDNRFAALGLGGRMTRDAKSLRLTPANHARLQRVVQELLARLEASWQDVAPVHCQLTKVTTYLFRARILNPYEPCLTAQLHLSGQGISSRIMLCLPRVMLEPVLAGLHEQKVVPSLAQVAPPAAPLGEVQPGAAQAGLLTDVPYQVAVRMGSIRTTLAPDQFAEGHVFPLSGLPEGQAALEINGKPVFMGNVGESQGQYALRITRPYPEAALPAPAAPPSFAPLAWPPAVPK